MRLTDKLVLLACCTGLSFAIGLSAGQSDSPKFEPTEVEHLKLEVAQRDAQLAQTRAQMACSQLPQQGQFQQALATLNGEAQKIKAGHKWPATVEFNPDSLSFYQSGPQPPVVAPKPTELPKPEAKK